MDDKLRKLERLAKQGDPDAIKQIPVERLRLGLEILPTYFTPDHAVYIFPTGIFALYREDDGSISEGPGLGPDYLFIGEFEGLDKSGWPYGEIERKLFLPNIEEEPVWLHPRVQKALIRRLTRGR